MTVFTDSYILDVAAQVFDNYQRLGGDGKVAKGTELLASLMNSVTEEGMASVS